MSEKANGIVGRNAVQRKSDGLKEGLESLCTHPTEMRFEFGEGILDRRKIRGVVR